MVFAVWAARPGLTTTELTAAFVDSCRYGRQSLEEIVRQEAPRRGFSTALVREYLTKNIVHELGPREYAGMELFLKWARELGPAKAVSPARTGLGASARPTAPTPV